MPDLPDFPGSIKDFIDQFPDTRADHRSIQEGCRMNDNERARVLAGPCEGAASWYLRMFSRRGIDCVTAERRHHCLPCTLTAAIACELANARRTGWLAGWDDAMGVYGRARVVQGGANA